MNLQGQIIKLDKKIDEIIGNQVQKVPVGQTIDPKSAYKHKFIINGPII